jgi:hypothetical protein
MGNHHSFFDAGTKHLLVIRYISGFKSLNLIFFVVVCTLYVDVITFVFLHSTLKCNLCIVCDM